MENEPKLPKLADISEGADYYRAVDIQLDIVNQMYDTLKSMPAGDPQSFRDGSLSSSLVCSPRRNLLLSVVAYQLLSLTAWQYKFMYIYIRFRMHFYAVSIFKFSNTSISDTQRCCTARLPRPQSRL